MTHEPSSNVLAWAVAARSLRGTSCFVAGGAVSIPGIASGASGGA